MGTVAEEHIADWETLRREKRTATDAGMRVYLDVCCLSRLPDDQTQASIREETAAVRQVLAQPLGGTAYRSAGDAFLRRDEHCGYPLNYGPPPAETHRPNLGKPSNSRAKSAILAQGARTMIATGQLTDEQFERHALELLQRELSPDGIA
jgi:hypothetical protein